MLSATVKEGYSRRNWWWDSGWQWPWILDKAKVKVCDSACIEIAKFLKNANRGI